MGWVLTQFYVLLGVCLSPGGFPWGSITSRLSPDLTSPGLGLLRTSSLAFFSSHLFTIVSTL